MNNNTPTKKQQQQLNTTIEQLKNKDYNYQEQTPKPIDWTNYDLAQTSEINDTLLHTRHYKTSCL